MSFNPAAPDAPAPRHPWTLAAAFELVGVGLHTGEPARLRVSPAGAGTGLSFRRMDLIGQPVIPARVEHVAASYLSTTLARAGASVQTVEHVLAALFGLGVTDAWLELTGPEVPGLDGSALELGQAICAAGLTELPGERVVVALPHTGVHEGERSVSAMPGRDTRLTVAVDYGHPQAGPSLLSVLLTPAVFLSDIAPARTFCLAAEAEAMRAAGLAKGGSHDNAVVFYPAGPSTPLRFLDEPARHKLLDLLGDLALVGADWRGHVVAVKAGHGLHTALARAIVATSKAPHLQEASP